MRPSFLVDECLPSEARARAATTYPLTDLAPVEAIVGNDQLVSERALTQALRELALDVTDLFERGARGLGDEEVWALAAAEGRILVTRDLDFPLRVHGPRPAGLVLVRAPDDATAPMLGALVRSLLMAVRPATTVGTITVVSPGRYRQRPW